MTQRQANDPSIDRLTYKTTVLAFMEAVVALVKEKTISHELADNIILLFVFNLIKSNVDQRLIKEVLEELLADLNAEAEGTAERVSVARAFASDEGSGP